MKELTFTCEESHCDKSNEDDFLPMPLPTKRLAYRGLNLSRGALIRLRNAGEIDLVYFPEDVIPGQGRIMAVRDSLDAWIDRKVKASVIPGYFPGSKDVPKIEVITQHVTECFQCQTMRKRADYWKRRLNVLEGNCSAKSQ